MNPEQTDSIQRLISAIAQAGSTESSDGLIALLGEPAVAAVLSTPAPESSWLSCCITSTADDFIALTLFETLQNHTQTLLPITDADLIIAYERGLSMARTIWAITQQARIREAEPRRHPVDLDAQVALYARDAQVPPAHLGIARSAIDADINELEKESDTEEHLTKPSDKSML